jgi:Fe-S oxidoreductase
MSDTAAMLRSNPAHLVPDATELARTIDVLLACAEACTACADACLAEEDVAPLRRCIRLDLDCADLCAAAVRMLSRQAGGGSVAVGAVLEAVAQAARACREECLRHAPMHEHCRLCAQACARAVRVAEATRDARAAQG